MGLAHTYGKRPALRGVDLFVGPGECVAVLGANGSGKSTLLTLLAGALPVGRGRATALPLLPSERDRRRRTAAVLERTPVRAALSGREQTIATLRLRGVGRAEGRERAAAWLDRFGLAAVADLPAGEYSRGMRRRLLLAEALAADPDVLLLDEPTEGLDPQGRAVLAGALEAHASGGGAALLALHDAAFAAATCGRVLLLHRGRVVADGSPEALVERLGGEAVLEVSCAEAPTGDPPAPLRSLEVGRERIRLGAPRGGAHLASAVRWLVEHEAGVRAIEVREPDLADAYAAWTGASLHGRAAGPRDGG